jgi:hypothetical protein
MKIDVIIFKFSAEILLKKALFPGGNTNEQVEIIMQTIREPTQQGKFSKILVD